MRCNVGEADGLDGIDLDVTVFHGVALAHLHALAFPDADGDSDAAVANAGAQALGELHGGLWEDGLDQFVAAGEAQFLDDFADVLRRYQAHDEAVKQMVINISLSVVVLAIASSIVLSLIFPKTEQRKNEDDVDPEDEPGVI